MQFSGMPFLINLYFTRLFFFTRPQKKLFAPHAPEKKVKYSRTSLLRLLFCPKQNGGRPIGGCRGCGGRMSLSVQMFHFRTV